MYEWDRYDVTVSSPSWELPAWEKELQFDNAGEAFTEFRAAVDRAIGTGERCSIYLVARVGRTAQTLGKFEWASAA